MSKPKFDIREGEHGPEYWEADEKIAFINATGNLQSTHGNAGRKEEVEAWAEKHAAKEEPENLAPHMKGIPTHMIPKGVPEAEPFIQPGLGVNAGNYIWWAWHQPDAVFEGIYKKSKDQFKKDHGPLLEQITKKYSA